MSNEIKSQEIAVFNSKGLFMTIMDTQFHLRKVKFRIATYDESKSSGNKITESAQFQLSFRDCIKILELLRVNLLLPMALKNIKESEKPQFPDPAYKVSGGSDENGNLIFRSFEIHYLPDKKKWKIKILNAEGERSRQGGVVRKSKKNGADTDLTHNLGINLEYPDLLGAFAMIEKHIDAYLYIRYGALRYREMINNVASAGDGMKQLARKESEGTEYMRGHGIPLSNV